MKMAAYMLGTAAVSAEMFCSILSAKRFLGPCVTSLPFTSTAPMSGFPRSSKKLLDHTLVVPNSRSSMRMRCSLRRGLSGVALCSGGLERAHGTNSREEAEWRGRSQGT